MTTKHWIGICLLAILGMSRTLSAEVRSLGRAPTQGRVQPVSHCDGCGDAAALWAPAPCGGGCPTVPTMVGPACRPGCGLVLGEFLCDVRNGVDRSLRCVLGAVLPCGLCQGSYDVCSGTVCHGGCSGGCGTCSSGCDSCASGCDSCGGGCSDGCSAGCAGSAPTYGGETLTPTPAAPQPMPQPAVTNPFQDDPPAPATSARSSMHQAPRLSQRPVPQKRMQIRRTTYQTPASPR